MLFEYACSDDSLLGQGCQRIGVECTRLTKQVVDLSDPEQVNQVLGQVQAMPGADVWLSITCTFHSPLQNLNIHQYGRSYEQKLKKKQKVVRRMVNLALPVIEIVVANGGRVAVEWPQECQLWLLKELQTLERCFGT